MKKSYIITITAFIFFNSIPVYAEFLSHTFSEHKIPETKGLEKESKLESRKIWISPSVSLDMYVEETKTKRSQSGIVPGVGYGIRWNPSRWQSIGAGIKSKALLSLDVYVQASYIDATDDFPGDDFFAVDMLPAITIIDWISIGYGYRWKRSQHDGLDNQTTPLFSVGIRKGF